MRLFGYDITVEKKTPPGGVSTPLADRANTLVRDVGTSAAPAMGDRPDAGPLPRVDAPTDGSQRHVPIRWQYQYGYNQTWTSRRNALTPFTLLRQLADVSDTIRICIETRKDQSCALGWDIAPRDKKAGKDEYSARIDAARMFFRRPDKKRDFQTWLRMAIEEVLVVDALSVYRRKTRGGELYALELKDGTTFLPLLDPTTGDTPDAPNVAFRQIINGVPMKGGDCSVDDLYYRPRTVRTHTPYGLSPTEAVLLSVNAALNRQAFNLAYYTDGNVPEGLLEAPKGFTTQQLIEFQEYIDDYLTGDLGRRRKLKVVHEGGSKVYQFKEPDFATVYDEWLLKVACAAFSVLPSEIGFTADVNRSTADSQENATYRRGVRPMALYFKSLFDDVLALDMKHPELEWVWTGGEVEDKKQQAETDAIYVGIGKVSVDELRLRDGQEPIGLGPYVDTPMGPVFVEELLVKPVDGDPDSSEVHDPPSKVDPTGEQEPPADGSNPKGENLTPPATGEPSTKKAVLAEATLADLRKWRAVAVKCVKAGKPVRDFASPEIPLELHARVERFLAHAGTDVGKVVMAFDLAVSEYTKAAESRVQTAAERRMAKAVKKLMARHFNKQGAAFVAHLKDELK